MRIRSLDHLAPTVRDIEATVRFYEALGMRRETFGAAGAPGPGGRTALHLGGQKLNLNLVELSRPLAS